MRPGLRSVLSAAMLLGLAACGGESGPHFIAFMSGDVVTPKVTTQASGSADFRASGAAIEYTVIVHNIVAVTRVSVHAGAGGVNGPLVADLFTGPTTGTIVSATLATGTLTAAQIAGMTPDSLQVLMASGKAYVLVSTSAQPNGEIRGQIFAN